MTKLLCKNNESFSANNNHTTTFNVPFFYRLPEWKSVVILECDKSKKTPGEAEFKFVKVAENKWVSRTSNNRNY